MRASSNWLAGKGLSMPVLNMSAVGLILYELFSVKCGQVLIYCFV